MEDEKSKTSENTRNKSNFAFVFGVFMTILYVAFGIVLLFTDIFEMSMPHTARIILGTLLVLYGFYRGYRIIKK